MKQGLCLMKTAPIKMVLNEKREKVKIKKDLVVPQSLSFFPSPSGKRGAGLRCKLQARTASDLTEAASPLLQGFRCSSLVLRFEIVITSSCPKGYQNFIIKY